MSVLQSRIPIDALRRVAAELHTLGEPARLTLLWWLMQGERTVTELCAVTGFRQQAISHHLTLLKLRHIVAVERAGKSNLYRLTDSGREAMRRAAIPGTPP
jgi:ArsR family transcriptional regulator